MIIDELLLYEGNQTLQDVLWKKMYQLQGGSIHFVLHCATSHHPVTDSLPCWLKIPYLCYPGLGVRRLGGDLFFLMRKKSWVIKSCFQKVKPHQTLPDLTKPAFMCILCFSSYCKSEQTRVFSLHCIIVTS